VKRGPKIVQKKATGDMQILKSERRTGRARGGIFFIDDEKKVGGRKGGEERPG